MGDCSASIDEKDRKVKGIATFVSFCDLDPQDHQICSWEKHQ